MLKKVGSLLQNSEMFHYFGEENKVNVSVLGTEKKRDKIFFSEKGSKLWLSMLNRESGTSMVMVIVRRTRG